MAPDPRESLEVFLKTIWKPPPGHDKYWVYIPTLRRSDEEWKKTFYQLPDHWSYVYKHILGAAAQGKDVYISPILYNKAVVDRPSVMGSWCVWTEFDGDAPTEWPEATNDHATGEPQAAPGPPSVRVQSSGERYEHVYWILDEFATNVEWLENINRSIAYGYNADLSAWDYSQLLRPPATINIGKTNKQLPVLLAALDETTYSSDAFRNLAPVAQSLLIEIADSEIVDFTDIVAKYAIHADEYDLMQKSQAQVTLNADGRSAAMMRIAYYCAEIGMAELEVYSVLYYLDEKWDKFKKRKDRSKQLLNIVSKAKLKYPESIATAEEFQEAFEDRGDIDRDPRTVFGFRDFLVSEYHIDWMINRLAARKTVGLIASAPGKGKTQFMLNMATHAALGMPFVGYEMARPHKVLFLSLEMGPELLHEFIHNMARAFTEEQHYILQDQCILMPAGQQMSLQKHRNPKEISAGRVFLEELIKEYKPDAVYIDSLARVLPGKFEDEDVIELFSFFSKLRYKYDTYFFIVHHNRKAQGDNKRPKNLEDIYGSQYIGGEVDWALTLFPEAEPNVLEVNEVKNRLAQQRRPYHIRRIENLQFEVVENYIPTSVAKGGIDLSGLRTGAANASVQSSTGLHSFE